MNHKFSVNINCENDAFYDGNGPHEVAKILRKLAHMLENGNVPIYDKHSNILDINGYICGTFVCPDFQKFNE